MHGCEIKKKEERKAEKKEYKEKGAGEEFLRG